MTKAKCTNSYVRKHNNGIIIKANNLNCLIMIFMPYFERKLMSSDLAVSTVYTFNESKCRVINLIKILIEFTLKESLQICRMMYINEYWVISFCFTNAGNLKNEYQKRYFVMMMLLFLHFCIANLSLITVLRKDDIFVWTVMNFSSLWPNLTDVTRNKVLFLSDNNRNA